ncbi:MAG: glycosyltransferase [Anaerolineales bacterium]|nr:MAG: glycosyltransferase [Anaerolineales bacterium]
MRVSVIATVLNEGESLPRLLDSLAAQSRAPDEVVFCDGGSTDYTLELLEAERRFPLVVLKRPGANISQGRNAAIEAAGGEIIASTDAGVRLSANWLESLVGPLERGQAQVAAGFFVPEPRSVFETALGATVLPLPEEIDPGAFLPSSRSVAFLKNAWAEVGGYPEWLDYCEDLIFDLRLRERFGTFKWVPEAIAHFRPRSGLGAFFLQYYRYARGDGKADLWRWRHAIRYLTYLAAVPLIAYAGLVASRCWWALFLPGGLAMLWVPFRRLLRTWRGLGAGERLQAVLWVPVIRLTGDLAKMIGYPVGVVWRWRNRRRADRSGVQLHIDQDGQAGQGE